MTDCKNFGTYFKCKVMHMQYIITFRKVWQWTKLLFSSVSFKRYIPKEYVLASSFFNYVTELDIYTTYTWGHDSMQNKIRNLLIPQFKISSQE
jgi:hypothetical protein